MPYSWPISGAFTSTASGRSAGSVPVQRCMFQAFSVDCTEPPWRFW